MTFIGKAIYAFIGLLSLVASGYFIVQLLQVYEASSWPSVTGKVVESSVILEKKSIGKTATRQNFYFPEIIYKYTVNNKTYKNSDGYTPGNKKKYLGTGSRESANSLLSKYPKGSDILVYYNPKNQKQSILSTKQHSTNYIPAAIFFIIFIFSIYMIFIKIPHSSPRKTL